jgi:hypothetical protein
MKILACVLLLCSTAAFGKESGQMKVSDLKEICDATSHAESVAACKFYVLGVVEGLQIGVGIANDKAHFCMPDGVTATNMVQTVRVKMAGDLVLHPEDKDMPAVSFVGAVMVSTYPCK